MAIGNFDGLHRGHQALLHRCTELAGDGLDPAVVTFEPLPREWFDPKGAPARLYSARDKVLGLRRAGMDLIGLMRFNDRLARLEAEEFVERLLVGGLRARHVVIGDDFRFGHRRRGDRGLLESLGEQHGFDVHAMETVASGGERVSSTAVREALSSGDLDRARELLGRPYRLCGRVIQGQQLGRTLGYPTANVRPPGPRCALSGVFAVRARVNGGDWRPGVASLGNRPVVGGGETLLEVHLFDTREGLYGQFLETEFVARLRDEMNFEGLEALVAQMRRDEDLAREKLAVTPAATSRHGRD